MAKFGLKSETSVEEQFEAAHGDLRRALVRGIAHRVGKSVEPISIPDASSEMPLAEIYYRKLHTKRFSGLVERLLSRWWR
jgi:hypothetical protein